MKIVILAVCFQLNNAFSLILFGGMCYHLVCSGRKAGLILFGGMCYHLGYSGRKAGLILFGGMCYH